MVSREKQICQYQQARLVLLAKEVQQGGEGLGLLKILMVVLEEIHRRDNRAILTVQGGMAVMEVMEAKVEELISSCQGGQQEKEEEAGQEEMEGMRLPQRWALPGVTAEMVSRVRMGPVEKMGLREEMALI